MRKALAILAALVLGNSAFAQGVPIPLPAASATSSIIPSTVKTTQSGTDTNVSVPGQFYLLEVTLSQWGSATGGWLWLADSATVLADGTYTGANTPGNCIPVGPIVSPATSSFITMTNALGIPKTSNGIFAAFSTGADCNHLVKAPAYIAVQYVSP